MNGWEILLSFLLWYLSLFVCAYFWFDELLHIKFLLKLYIFITIIALKWSFYLGTKGYFIAYTTSKDEAGEMRFIEFPVIWM